MNERVLVLGGGVGGVVAARTLRSELPADREVVLIDRAPDHLFQPSLLWMLTGERRLEEIRRPIAGLEEDGIDVRRAEIEAIDPEARAVRADGERLEGDALVVALGAELRPDLIPGLEDAGHNLYSADGVRDFRRALRDHRGGRIAVLTSEPAYKCPAAPYEAAMLVEAELRGRGVRAETELQLIAAEPGPMGVAGPEVSEQVRSMVEDRGVEYRPEHRVSRVDGEEGRLVFESGGESDFDLLLYVPPHRAPVVVRDSGLTDDSGWIPVDRDSLATEWEDVYAVGDVNHVALAMGKALPMAGVFASGEAKVVARNLANRWTGDGESVAFDGHGACWLEAGDGRAGFGHGDFFAEPTPEVRLHPPRPWWHWGKILYEKYWLWRWF